MEDRNKDRNEEHTSSASNQANSSDNCTQNTAKQDATKPINITDHITKSRDGLIDVGNKNLPHDSNQILNSTTDSHINRAIPINTICKTAKTMINLRMAHKIALEDDFKFEQGMNISGPLMSLSPILGTTPVSASSSPTLHDKVKEMVHEAFWNSLSDELKTIESENVSDREYKLSLQLLADIKKRIKHLLLLPQHTRLMDELQDKLDLKVMKNLSSVGGLDLNDYCKFILDFLAKLCAPVRDGMLQELSQEKDLTKLFRGIIELLDMMRLDLANFAIDTVKPHLKAHSIRYEKEKFALLLEQQGEIGIDGLEYTKIWLKRSVDELESTQGLADMMKELLKEEENDNCEILIASTSNKNFDDRCKTKNEKILQSGLVDKVLCAAYCELLEWEPKKQQIYPETLIFDEATFKQFGEQLKYITLVASILLTTFAFVRQYGLQDNENFKPLIKSNVIILATSSYESNKDDIDSIKLETISTKLVEDIKEQLIKSKHKSGIEAFDVQKEVLVRQIMDLKNPSNRIFNLARRRILEFADTLLNIDSKRQSRKLKESPPPISIPLGLDCLSNELTLLMAQFVKIIHYNRKVFYSYYQKIIVNQISEII